MIVSMATTPERIRDWYKSAHRGALVISPRLAGSQLIQLCKIHANQDYSRALLSAVVSSRAADQEVMKHALVASGQDPAVANSVATSGRASSVILRKLLKSPDRSVREHAELAIISKEIEEGIAPLHLERILARHRGDGGISLGVRSLVARNLQTPRKILDALAHDEADLVSEIARRTIRRQRKAPAPSRSFSARTPPTKSSKLSARRRPTGGP